MKATLEFNLPDDRCMFRLHMTGPEWAFALWDIDQRLRDLLKHGDLSDHVQQALQGTRDHLYGCLDQRGLSFDMIE